RRRSLRRFHRPDRIDLNRYRAMLSLAPESDDDGSSTLTYHRRKRYGRRGGDALMPRVLQLIPTLDRSGAEKQLVLLAKGLPKERFKVEVAALTRLGPLEHDLRDAGIPVTLIGKPLKADPFALMRLSRFLKRSRFDVVQTWVFAANAYGRV